MNIVILDSCTANPGDLSWGPLEKMGTVKIYDRTSKEELLERAKDADILVTNKTVIDKETIKSLPNLKFIALLSTGFNVVDTVYAKERGIPVSNIPSYSTEAVAQLVFALILDHYNHVALHSNAVFAGEWVNAPDFCFMKSNLFELYGKTFGVIGFGAIGQKAAEIANAFGMKVLVNSRRQPENLPAYAKFTSKEDLVKQADIISLHTPLTNETENMVDEGFLSMMKKSAILINTARGALIDEDALAKALHEGQIAGAGLDVLSSEPPSKDNPLLSAPNCVITPHIAWAAQETRARLLSVFFENVEAFINGSPINVVNP